MYLSVFCAIPKVEPEPCPPTALSVAPWLPPAWTSRAWAAVVVRNTRMTAAKSLCAIPLTEGYILPGKKQVFHWRKIYGSQFDHLDRHQYRHRHRSRLSSLRFLNDFRLYRHFAADIVFGQGEVIPPRLLKYRVRNRCTRRSILFFSGYHISAQKISALLRAVLLYAAVHTASVAASVALYETCKRRPAYTVMGDQDTLEQGNTGIASDEYRTIARLARARHGRREGKATRQRVWNGGQKIRRIFTQP